MENLSKIDLTEANRKLDRSLKVIRDHAIILMKNETLQEYQKKIKGIKAETLGMFQVIAFQTFQEIFFREYGNNYDVNKLNLSLHFFVDDDLRPYLFYDVKDFTVEKDFNDDARSFNQNAYVDGDYNNLLELDEMAAMEEVEFFGLSFASDNPYETATEDITAPEDYKVFRPRKLLVKPKEVYQQAEKITIDKFTRYYEKVLKPLFSKKYNIPL